MWTLWFIPLLGLIFVGTAVVAIVIALVWRPRRPLQWLGLAALPFGCAALPVLALMFLVGAGALLQKDDAALFREVWGFTPDMREDQMLSDDFGIWSDRWIYMRMEAGPRDRQRMLDVALRRAAMTPEQFANFRQSHGFIWWDTACDAPDIRDASGYRDWQWLLVLDCPERGLLFFVAFRP